MGGPLGDALSAAQRALAQETVESLATEYTRLFMANAQHGARGKVPVPPWEDCYTDGRERKIFGPRSRAALEAYVSAGLGYDGMLSSPQDHIGLELCFVAALLDEEERGERNGGTRRDFVASHLRSFSPALGNTLTASSQACFWQEVGHALAALPERLQ